MKKCILTSAGINKLADNLADCEKIYLFYKSEEKITFEQHLNLLKFKAGIEYLKADSNEEIIFQLGAISKSAKDDDVFVLLDSSISIPKFINEKLHFEKITTKLTATKQTKKTQKIVDDKPLKEPKPKKASETITSKTKQETKPDTSELDGLQKEFYDLLNFNVNKLTIVNNFGLPLFISRLGRAIVESKTIAEFEQRIHFDFQRSAEAELILKNTATPTKFKKLKDLANKFIEL